MLTSGFNSKNSHRAMPSCVRHSALPAGFPHRLCGPGSSYAIAIRSGERADALCAARTSLRHVLLLGTTWAFITCISTSRP